MHYGEAWIYAYICQMRTWSKCGSESLLLISSSGSYASNTLRQSGIHAWTAKTRKPIHYHWKGINALTEMYSVFQAEIPVPGSLETEMNDDLVKQLVAEPRVLICGQALSHCVNFSVRDLMLAWPCERIGDLGLLLGMSSPVQGFEDDAERFVAFMREEGAQVVGKE